MPAAPTKLWEFFHRGEKQNTSYHKAYCLGCIGIAAEPTDVDDTLWRAVFVSAPMQVTPVLGEQRAMAAHLNCCPYASEKAREAAQKIREKNAMVKKTAPDADNYTSIPAVIGIWWIW
ncbi:hypothetical protein R3P38DRAFT_2772471 [Favolaschia claudopus]|uniref:Uncharacterized protein n=1 Tax=Favolaschia claudopus TaxID=2862362 RepID=A0AAW0C519_9AGAR